MTIRGLEHVRPGPPKWLDDVRTAIELWARFSGNRADIDRVTPLKEKKTRVYRLEAVGPGGEAIIAKRRVSAELEIERAVYRQMSPLMPVPMVRLYEAVTIGEYTWHFLEDAGRNHYDRDNRAHVEAFAAWLVSVHSALEGSGAGSLPEHGPNRYLEHLDSARCRIATGLVNPACDEERRHSLRRLDRLLLALRSAWTGLVDAAGEWPETLVHGDLQAKNIFVREGSAAATILPIDWETAGWGTPVADLAPLADDSPAADGLLERYRVARFGDSMTAADLRRAASVGRAFRFVAAIDWMSSNLKTYYVVKPVQYLGVFADGLREATRAAGVGLRE